MKGPSINLQATWLRVTLLIAVALFTVSSYALTIGSRVSANGVVNVRSTAAGSILGTQGTGSQGSIVAGPQVAALSGTS